MGGVVGEKKVFYLLRFQNCNEREKEREGGLFFIYLFSYRFLCRLGILYVIPIKV